MRFRRKLGVGKQASDGLQVRAVHQGALAQTHAPLGILLGEDVAQRLTAAAELAAPRGAETLGRGPACLQLGHGRLLITIWRKGGYRPVA